MKFQEFSDAQVQHTGNVITYAEKKKEEKPWISQKKVQY